MLHACTVQLNEPPLLLAIASATDAECWDSCNGLAFVLARDGTPPYTIQWDDPAGQTTAQQAFMALVLEGAG